MGQQTRMALSMLCELACRVLFLSFKAIAFFSRSDKKTNLFGKACTTFHGNTSIIVFFFVHCTPLRYVSRKYLALLEFVIEKTRKTRYICLPWTPLLHPYCVNCGATVLTNWYSLFFCVVFVSFSVFLFTHTHTHLNPVISFVIHRRAFMVNANNGTRHFFLVNIKNEKARTKNRKNNGCCCWCVVKWKKSGLKKWEPEDRLDDLVCQSMFRFCVSKFRLRRLSRQRKRNRCNNTNTNPQSRRRTASAVPLLLTSLPPLVK